MNKRVKISLITNFILTLTLIIVFTVSFFPSNYVAISTTNSEPIYNGDRDNNCVSLMFNVYEGEEIVYKILDVLKEKDAEATFFVGGTFIDDKADMLLKILNEGHELGNHGFLHKDHKTLSESENIKEILNCHNVVKSLTGYEMKLFAPPSGSFSSKTLKVANELNYLTIMWSKDTIDWRDNNSNLIFSRATSKVEGGDLILMHPKQHTLNALPQIIDYYKKLNLNVVKVSKCIGS